MVDNLKTCISTDLWYKVKAGKQNDMVKIQASYSACQEILSPLTEHKELSNTNLEIDQILRT